MRVAYRGIQSSDPGLRGLAFEYLEGVLPPQIAARLWEALEAPAESRSTKQDPERALEELRKSTETPAVQQTPAGKLPGEN